MQNIQGKILPNLMEMLSSNKLSIDMLMGNNPAEKASQMTANSVITSESAERITQNALNGVVETLNPASENIDALTLEVIKSGDLAREIFHNLGFQVAGDFVRL